MKLPIVAMLLATAGCSDGSGSSASDDQSDNQITSPPATLTLADICPDIDAKFPDVEFGFPSNDRQRTVFATYADDLRPLLTQIEESQRALLAKYVADIDYVVQLPEDPYVDDDGELVMSALEASESMDEAVGRMRPACADAGIPVFQ